MNRQPINVHEGERLAAGFLAGVCFIRALRRGSLLGLIAAGCLIYRALSGHCYGYEWLGVSTCKRRP